MTDSRYTTGLKQRMWNRWRARFLNNENEYGAKNRAISKIWELKGTDCRKDMQRSFAIWRGATVFNNERQQKIRKLLRRAHNDRTHEAFYRWMGYST